MPTWRGIQLFLVLIVGALGVRLASRWLDVAEVRGRSMSPALLPEDRLLVVRAAPRAGDIVLAHDPRDPRREVIKRVANVDTSGVTLRGDNPAASTDARTFGAVPLAAVEWRVVARYWPPRRVGRVPPPMIVDEGGEAACTFPSSLIAGT
jgi:nickel-type superoxide dismutase maturation protease